MLWIIFAHYIADWGLQNEFVSKNKGKYWIIMLSHCMIWTGLICFVLNWLGIFTYWKFIFLLVGHWISDKWKMDRIKNSCQASKEDEENNLQLLYIDQAIHLAQCIIVYVF